MKKRMDYRHEWKHELAPTDLLLLRPRLQAVMQFDKHQKDGKYFIRSLYFDTPFDTALREKLDGVNCREKFRIRYYNFNYSYIQLEKKSKQNGLGAKEQVFLTRKEAQRIADMDISWMREDARPLVQELYVKMKTQGLAPKTIVDYNREAYVFAPGNVRVTFDSNIRTGLSCTDFLDPSCVTVPAGDPMLLMEVKWDGFLPDVIRDIVQLTGRRVGAYSKYAACRMYD